MKDSNNISTNTKSFQEIWATLSTAERDELSIKFFQKKCCKTRQTVWNWGAGATTPHPLVRDAVCALVSKAIGQKCFSNTLFPEA